MVAELCAIPRRDCSVVEEVNEAAGALGLEVVNVIESPIQGAEGNVEYLALYRFDEASMCQAQRLAKLQRFKARASLSS